MHLQRLAYSVTEVAEVGQKLVVVGGDKVGPQESGIVRLWTLRDQVVSPYGSGLASLSGVVTEDTACQLKLLPN
jgi:hypothetical protein